MKTDGSVITVTTYKAGPFSLLLGEYDRRLCLCSWIGGKAHDVTIKRVCSHLGTDLREGRTPLLDLAARELDEYFGGERRNFDLPLLLCGSEFQRRVWDALTEIPFGATWSYAELARSIGRPTAVRAVANANGANPVSIFVPCHRVIGSDGSLTGYGGGLDAKRFLLSTESVLSPELPL